MSRYRLVKGVPLYKGHCGYCNALVAKQKHARLCPFSPKNKKA